jgi:hypothetical protein
MGGGDSTLCTVNRACAPVAFEAKAGADFARDPVQEIQGMIRFGQELLNLHRAQLRDVIVENRRAADDDWLHGLLAPNSSANFDA